MGCPRPRLRLIALACAAATALLLCPSTLGPASAAATEQPRFELKDSPDGFDWGGLVVDLAVAAFTAGAVYAAFRATRSTERSASAQVEHARRAATLQHLSQRQTDYRELVRQIGDLPAPREPIPEAQWQALLRLMGIWEHTAAGVTAGVLDLEVLNKMTGGNLLATYSKYSRFIRIRRRDNLRVYDQLEILIDKLLTLQASVYRITRKSIRSLDEDGVVAESTRQRLKQLKDEGPHTYHAFLRRLLELDLERDQTVIMASCREPAFRIEPMADTDTDEVVALFESLQAATAGAYPPTARTRAEGGVAEWLAKHRADTKLVAREDGKIVGYVEIEDLARTLDDPSTAPEMHGYWNRALQHPAQRDAEPLDIHQIGILKRLAVLPERQSRGIGRLLLRHAIQVIQFSHGRIPALVVLTVLENSIKLYESEGATRLSTFTGQAGDDLYSFVF